MKIVKSYKNNGGGNGTKMPLIRCLYDISFSSSLHGWCVGAGQALVTIDGGKIWENHYSQDKRLPYGQSNRVFVKNDSECWIASFFFNECCFTQDQGKSWTRFSLGNGMYPKDIFFLENFGWIIGNDRSESANVGEIFFTADDGHTWEQKEIALKGNPVRIRFVNENDGLLLENSTISNSSSLSKTSDGGRTFHSISAFDEVINDFALSPGGQILMVSDSEIVSLNLSDKKGSPRTVKTDSAMNGVILNSDGQALAFGDLGKLMYSNDDGLLWKTVPFDNSENLLTGCFLTTEQAVVISNQGIYLVFLKD